MAQSTPALTDLPADLDIRRVDRIVVTYLAVASIWIVVSGPVAQWVAVRIGATGTAVEISKGLAFVLVTAFVLRAALRGWALRLQMAARIEHEAAQRLRQADELRSAFLSGVSHELRTPLTSIVGYADTLQRLGESGRVDEVEQLTTRLVVNAHRLQSLVLDLLDTDALMRGMGHLALRHVDVGQVVRQVVDGYQMDGRRLHLQGQQQVFAELDVPKFERIVAMLLDNAVRHTPEHAEITIRWVQEADELCVQVEDTGDGIPRALAGAMFEPFVQGELAARQPSPGLGLGLTLVEQYVRLHSGEVTIAGEAGCGACVTVRVPLVHGHA